MTTLERPQWSVQASPFHVYAAISAVQAELAETGIAKERKNAQQNYKFRGIEDVFSAVCPLLVKHKLCVLPRMVSQRSMDRPSKAGGLNIFSVVEAEFDFVCSIDGSSHTVRTIGEGMDSADKSSNKAMAAAYKYAILLTFCVPTQGVVIDGDETTGEESVKPAAKPKSNPDEKKTDDGAWAEATMTPDTKTFKDADEAITLIKSIGDQKTLDALKPRLNAQKANLGKEWGRVKDAYTEQADIIYYSEIPF